MSVGANHSFGSQRSEGSQGGFHGCLENLNYNGLNLIDLAKRKVQHVILKVMSSDLCGFNCLSQLAGEKRCKDTRHERADQLYSPAANWCYADVQIVILGFE